MSCNTNIDDRGLREDLMTTRLELAKARQEKAEEVANVQWEMQEARHAFEIRQADLDALNLRRLSEYLDVFLKYHVRRGFIQGLDTNAALIVGQQPSHTIVDTATKAGFWRSPSTESISVLRQATDRLLFEDASQPSPTGQELPLYLESMEMSDRSGQQSPDDLAIARDIIEDLDYCRAQRFEEQGFFSLPFSPRKDSLSPRTSLTELSQQEEFHGVKVENLPACDLASITREQWQRWDVPDRLRYAYFQAHVFYNEACEQIHRLGDFDSMWLYLLDLERDQRSGWQLVKTVRLTELHKLLRELTSTDIQDAKNYRPKNEKAAAASSGRSSVLARCRKDDGLRESVY